MKRIGNDTLILETDAEAARAEAIVRATQHREATHFPVRKGRVVPKLLEEFGDGKEPRKKIA